MATVSIDKLLATVIQLKASDLHITVGQPPVVRLHGRMRKLDAKDPRQRRHHGADEEHHPRPLPAGVAGEGRGRLRLRVRRRPGSASPSSSSAATSAWCCGASRASS